MNDAERLLHLLTKSLVPPEGRRHALTLDGGRLSLGLAMPDGTWQIVGFDEDDFKKDVDALAAEILTGLPS